MLVSCDGMVWDSRTAVMSVTPSQSQLEVIWTAPTASSSHCSENREKKMSKTLWEKRYEALRYPELSAEPERLTSSPPTSRERRRECKNEDKLYVQGWEPTGRSSNTRHARGSNQSVVNNSDRPSKWCQNRSCIRDHTAEFPAGATRAPVLRSRETSSHASSLTKALRDN